MRPISSIIFKGAGKIVFAAHFELLFLFDFAFGWTSFTMAEATRSLDDQSRSANGRSSGFDYMRVLLAMLVVLLHTAIVSYGTSGDAIFWNGPLKIVYRIVLPMFFALSGYLVAGSLERSKTVGGFLALRVIRIYPALAVETLISAFLIGPLITTLPLRDYVADPRFATYLLNILGDVHFTLPGVFAGNPLPFVVNGQLWTVPYELLCYILLSFLAVLGVVRRRHLSLVFIATLTVALVGARFYKYGGHFPISEAAFPGSLLIISFLGGLALYLYRDVIPWSGTLAALAAATSVVLLAVLPYGEYASPVPVAYLTVYLGLTNARRIDALKHADISYGIFLYGFVIQQFVASILPGARHWYVNFGLALPIAAVIAALSWRVVERPALGSRSIIFRWEGRYLAWRRGRTGPISPAPGGLSRNDMLPPNAGRLG